MKSLRPFYLLAALAAGSAYAEDGQTLSAGQEEDTKKPQLSDARLGYDHDLYVHDGKAWLNICDPKHGAANKRAVIEKMVDKYIAEYAENTKDLKIPPEEAVAAFKVEAQTWMDPTLEVVSEPEMLVSMFVEAKTAGQNLEDPDVQMRIYALFSETASLNNTIFGNTSVGNDKTYCSFTSYHKGQAIKGAEWGHSWKYPRLSAQEITPP